MFVEYETIFQKTVSSYCTYERIAGILLRIYLKLRENTCDKYDQIPEVISPDVSNSIFRKQ